MARDTTFTTGTIVEADYLNADQDKDVGGIWGLKLSQPSTVLTDRVFLENSGYDSRYSLIIDGKRAWRDAPTTPVSAAGNATGAQNIWVHTTAGLLATNNFNVAVLPTGSSPSGTYKRKVGTALLNGSSELYGIKLTNGVQADANQFNSFAFKSIGQTKYETPLNIQGYSTQATSATQLFMVSADDGTDTQIQRFAVLGDGGAIVTSAASANLAFQAKVATDTYSRVSINSAGVITWGTGAAAGDTTLSRTGIGTLALNGTLDVPVIVNSTGSNGGRVLINDTVQATGYYIGTNPLASTDLSDTAGLARLAGTQTFTGAKTFSAASTFSGVATFTAQPVLSSVSLLVNAASTSADVLISNVSGNARLKVSADGSLRWLDGTGVSANDATLSYTSPNTLVLGNTTRLQVPYVATSSNDVVNKATMDQSITTKAATKTFVLFMA